MVGDNTENFFRELDAGFINFKTDIDSLHFNSANCTINYEEWSLPIPVFLSGSIVSYSFNTENGDIAFGVRFFSSDGVENTVAELTRVPSHLEVISGNFKAPTIGKFVFCWDNKFSWFTPKILSYSIELHQPSFAVADNARSLRARSLLHAVIDDCRRAERSLISSAGNVHALNDEILSLTTRIRSLQEERDGKLVHLRSLEEETAALRSQLILNHQKKNGLCLRSLDRIVLAKILSYFHVRALEPKTCKYWSALHIEACNHS